VGASEIAISKGVKTPRIWVGKSSSVVIKKVAPYRKALIEVWRIKLDLIALNHFGGGKAGILGEIWTKHPLGGGRPV